MSDTAAINKAYFNKIGAEYDQRYERTLGQLEHELRESMAFIGVAKGGRLLDYACGTGLLSRALGSQLSQCVGIDVSESMVEYYNAKAQSEGLSPAARQAHVGNLLLLESPNLAIFASPIFSNFDIAGVGAGFHHFDDQALAAARLAERLRPGGVLFILDFMPHNVEAHASHGVRANGFSEETVKGLFEGAGVGGEFKFKEMEADVVFHRENGEMRRRMFIARGTKL